MYFPTGNTTLIARRGYGGQVPTGLGGILDSIGSFVKSGVSAAVGVYAQGQQAAGQAQAYQSIAQQQAAPAGGSSMMVPVLVGGAALVGAAFLLTRKRRNPAPRRRRRR